PAHHWCFFGEIVDNESIIRVVLGVKDTSFDIKSVRTGYNIAVLFAEMHNFIDGTHGLRLEHPKFVKVSG
ncbi:hypothetical protein B0H17DRAFT_934347, partial [Mycena rosella]